MKKVFFILISSIFSAFSAYGEEELSRYQQECLSFTSKPEVNVSSSYGKLRYKFDKDKDFLQQKTAQKFAKQNQPMDSSFLPVGLTDVRDVIDLDFQVETMGLSHGYTCVYPKKINVNLEYSLPTIYILNTLKPGSCLYEIALRHEKTHMQIYIEALDYILPILKSYTVSLYDSVGIRIVARGESPEIAAKELNTLYFAKIQQLINSWRKDVEKEQLKLDTPEQYILENKICEEKETKPETF